MTINSILNQLSHVSISGFEENKIEQETLLLSLKSVKNTSENNHLVNIDTLPYLAKANICKYLNLSDVYNLKEASVFDYFYYKDKVNEFKKEVLKWSLEENINVDERRNVAAKQIIKCIEKRSNRLVLNDLNLTSIPNLKSLSFLDELHILGCDINNLNLSKPLLKKIVFSLPSQWNRDSHGFGHVVSVKNGTLVLGTVCRDYGDNRRNCWWSPSIDTLHIRICDLINDNN